MPIWNEDLSKSWNKLRDFGVPQTSEGTDLKETGLSRTSLFNKVSGGLHDALARQSPRAFSENPIEVPAVSCHQIGPWHWLKIFQRFAVL
jgi:hypothetical protein